MFSKDKSVSSEKVAMASATLISPGTVLHGNVESDNDLRIDGTIRGNVISKARIIVGPNGFVDGNISGYGADIIGKVTGNIEVTELLQLKGKCNVEGDIAAAQLQVEPSAVFNGRCHMGEGAAIVTMNTKDGQTAKAQ